MNIRQAKNEIKHTVEAYLKKDEAGDYEIPEIRQRPVLLMGPPGTTQDRAPSDCRSSGRRNSRGRPTL